MSGLTGRRTNEPTILTFLPVCPLSIGNLGYNDNADGVWLVSMWVIIKGREGGGGSNVGCFQNVIGGGRGTAGLAPAGGWVGGGRGLVPRLTGLV